MRTTGDRAVLDGTTPFLEAPPLAPAAVEAYGPPTRVEQTATLFEHCMRAIDKGSTTGTHGLPLIGSGDWNDGMNRVGPAGRGESTWLGFFLHSVLTEFVAVCDGWRHGRASRYRQDARRARVAARTAWDGEWYRRGYYDDGTPLGSAQNDECQHRFDRAVVGGAVGRRAASLCRARDGRRPHVADRRAARRWSCS